MLAGAILRNCLKDIPIQLLPNDRDDCFPNYAKLSPCDLRTKMRCSHYLTGVHNTPLVKVFEGCGELFSKSSPQKPRLLTKVPHKNRALTA